MQVNSRFDVETGYVAPIIDEARGLDPLANQVGTFVNKVWTPVSPHIEKIGMAAKYAGQNILNLRDEDSDDEAGPKTDKKAKKAAKKLAKANKSPAEVSTPKKDKADKKAKKIGKEKIKPQTEEAVEKPKKDKGDKKAKKLEKKAKTHDEAKVDKKDKKAAKETKVESIEEIALVAIDQIPLIADEVPSKIKGKKNKESFGVKHYTALASAIAFTNGMAILFRESPFLGFAFAGAWMDFVRVAYKSLPQEGWQITAFRASAFASLIISIVAANFTPKDSIWNAIPFFVLGVGVLVKCELNKNFKPEKSLFDIKTLNLGDRIKAVGVTPSMVSSTFSSAMVLGSGALTLPILPNGLQVTGATVLKANIRKGVDSWLEMVKGTENTTVKKTVLVGTFSLLSVIGGLSFYALEQKMLSNAALIAGVTAVNIVPFDTAARMLKNLLWNFSNKLKSQYTSKTEQTEKQDDLKEKLIEMAKHAPMAFMLLGMILGVSYPLNKYFLSNNLPIALSVVVAQEISTLLKPISKEWVGTTTSLIAELPLFMMLALGALNNDFALAMLADNIVFNLKDKVRPKAMEKVVELAAEPVVV